MHSPSDTLRQSSAKVGITTANNGSRAPHLSKCPLCLQRHALKAYGSVEQQLHTYLTSVQKEGNWIDSSSDMFIFQYRVDGALGGPENNPGK